MEDIVYTRGYIKSIIIGAKDFKDYKLSIVVVE